MQKNLISLKPEPLALWWQQKGSCKRTPAGVAFYQPTLGEYKVKVDLLLNAEVLCFLRLVKGEAGSEKYQLEIIEKCSPNQVRRQVIGEGQRCLRQSSEIKISVPPYSYDLILEFQTPWAA